MFIYELKKLLFKQYGLIFAVLCGLVQICMLIPLYDKADFPNAVTEAQYNIYMQIMEGRLTDEKTNFILFEQEQILTAQSELKSLQDKLISGELSDNDEYLSEYTKLEPIIKKADAFCMVFDKYKYVSKDPEKRYIIEDCKGMCRDYPDIPMLLFVVAMTSLYFLNEENSRMIVLIRSYANRKKNVFAAKLIVMIIAAVIMGIAVSFCEFILLYKNIGAKELNYPVQSIGYFSGCGYNISILEAFIAMAFIRITGYIFAICLTLLLAITVKKAVAVMAVPLSLCMIQQFIFTSADKAYYLPTGLLRASGYFRGDTYSADGGAKVFSTVSLNTLIYVVVAVIIIIGVTVAIGMKYYCGKRVNGIAVKIISMFVAVAVIFTGCGASDKVNARFNMRNSVSFAQNEDYYFVTEYDAKGTNLYAVSKSDGSRFPVIRTPFEDNINPAGKCIVGDDMYFMESDGIKGFSVTKIDLNNFCTEKAAGQSGLVRYSFLGLEYDDTIVFDKYVLNFFTDGKILFLITSDYEVYSCGLDLKNPQCIISDGIFNASLIWDGENIYYINNTLELKRLNPYTGESKNIADGFVKAFDINGDLIVYSNKGGIFEIDTAGTAVRELSDKKATGISFDGENIIFFSDNKLYHLRDSGEKVLYSGDLVYFSCIDECNKVICSKYDSETDNYIEFVEDLS